MRFEEVQKTGEELNLDPIVYGQFPKFTADVLTIGASYDMIKVANTTIAAGGQLSYALISERLQLLYGTSPVSAELYLHIYPGIMK